MGIVFAGSQFPDFVDKPLASAGLIPTGRVFLHSLPFAVPLWLVAIRYGWATGRLRASMAFVFAYGTHLVGDNYVAIQREGWHVPPDLLWPITDHQPRPEVPFWVGPEFIVLRVWTALSVVASLILAYYLLDDLSTQLRRAGE